MNEENSIVQNQSGGTDYVPSQVAIRTDYSIVDHAHAFGVTFLGRQHEEYKEVCQDYHLFEDLGDGWHLYLVSDGTSFKNCNREIGMEIKGFFTIGS